MAWVESASASFRARFDSIHAEDAEQTLYSLELVRERLGEVFPRTISGLTVVLHPSGASLAMARPLFPLARAMAAPAARRYVAGWAGSEELHVLTLASLSARAANVPGSKEMLQLTAAALYARRVIVENNDDVRRRPAPARVAVALRWAWLLEGGSRWFSGQTDYARAAIARRLREGGRPSFPPGIRDAPLLGGTVIDLVVHQRGELAAAELVSRLHPHGARAALKRAFDGRSIAHLEGAWRSHLARLATA